MIADIHSAFRTLCDNALPNISIKYENTEFRADLGTTFAVFQLGQVDTERQSQGRGSCLSYTGQATLTIKTDIKTGVDEAYTHADALIKFALENALSNGLKLIEPPFVGATEQDFDWLALPVFIPYQKDD